MTPQAPSVVEGQKDADKSMGKKNGSRLRNSA